MKYSDADSVKLTVFAGQDRLILDVAVPWHYKWKYLIVGFPWGEKFSTLTSYLSPGRKGLLLTHPWISLKASWKGIYSYGRGGAAKKIADFGIPYSWGKMASNLHSLDADTSWKWRKVSILRLSELQVKVEISTSYLQVGTARTPRSREKIYKYYGYWGESGDCDFLPLYELRLLISKLRLRLLTFFRAGSAST